MAENDPPWAEQAPYHFTPDESLPHFTCRYRGRILPFGAIFYDPQRYRDVRSLVRRAMATLNDAFAAGRPFVFVQGHGSRYRVELDPEEGVGKIQLWFGKEEQDGAV